MIIITKHAKREEKTGMGLTSEYALKCYRFMDQTQADSDYYNKTCKERRKDRDGTHFMASKFLGNRGSDERAAPPNLERVRLRPINKNIPIKGEGAKKGNKNPLHLCRILDLQLHLILTY